MFDTLDRCFICFVVQKESPFQNDSPLDSVLRVYSPTSVCRSLEAAAVPNLTSPALLRSQRPAVRSSAGGMSANSPSLAYITIISLCDDFMQSGCDGYLDM